MMYEAFVIYECMDVRMYEALCDQEEKLRLTAGALQGLQSHHM